MRKNLIAFYAATSLFIAIALINVLQVDFRFGPDFRLTSKAIHPEDPHFDPQKFKFDDYNSAQDIFYVLKAIFPLGSDRNYLETILSRQDNLNHYNKINQSMQNESRSIYVHQYQKTFPIRGTSSFCKGRPTSYFEIMATYNELDKLTSLALTGFCGKPLLVGQFERRESKEENR